jgi:hypothetical protein
MSYPPLNRMRPAPSRREMLWNTGGGLGGIALAYLLGQSGALAGAASTSPSTQPIANLNGGVHHRAKARRVIQLFMNGGASQCDLFDYKPKLIELNGKPFDPGAGVLFNRATATGTAGNVMASPYTWKQHGRCGRWVSSALPLLAKHVDEMAFLMAMNTPTSEHSGGVYRQTTGFVTPGFPSFGAWVSYGLGRLSDNLPAFVVLPDSRGLGYNGKNSFSAGFLPVAHQGTLVRATAATPIADLFPPPSAKFINAKSEADALALLEKLNREHLARNPGDSRLEARTSAYELAARMQLSAPELLDLSGEAEATKEAYGLNDKSTQDFGRNCLITRRMIERGVRFVQVWSGRDGANDNWDHHAGLKGRMDVCAAAIDKPCSALLTDLRQRGLLEDTLVIWTTEFGRNPFAQSDGRDHNGGTFISWLAGGGIKEGAAYGESDEWSWKAATHKTEAHDLHATALHLLGIDHTKLTFRYNGADRRLTDVHGHVVREILT